MTVTIETPNGDVDWVRNVLTQAGRKSVSVREADIIAAFGTNTLYADYTDVVDIAGVWLISDVNMSGTNYISSGATIYQGDGKIVLSGSLPAGTRQVLVTYAVRDGMSDYQIQQTIDMSKDYLRMNLFDLDIDFSGSTNYETLARTTMLTIASYYSLLAMNNGNAIQAGFNYRLDEYEIQTKLWGEGMIAETLLNAYWTRCTELIRTLMIVQNYPDVNIHVVDRSGVRRPYNKSKSVFDTMMSSTNSVQLVSDTSSYAIVLQEY